MTRFALTGALAGAVLFASAAAALDDEAARTARWNELAQDIFGARQIQQGNAKIALEAPERAEDAALVPVTISVQNPKDVKSITLVIDDNPAPVAAHVTFGPAGDPQSLKLRVRVNQYTYMHAIEETKDGALYETHRFVKASGGCSAPSGSYDAEALAEIGQMKLRFLGQSQEGQAREAQAVDPASELQRYAKGSGDTGLYARPLSQDPRCHLEWRKSAASRQRYFARRRPRDHLWRDCACQGQARDRSARQRQRRLRA